MKHRLDGHASSEPLAFRVFHKLRDGILQGEICPGTRLIERSLASQFYVSRTPVRRALRLLETEGLVCRLGCGGIKVAPVTVADALDVFAVRGVLEGLAARLAALRHSVDDISILWELQDQLGRLASIGATEKYSGCNLEFHERIWAASGSPRLLSALSDVSACLRRFTDLSQEVPGRMTESNAEHHEILSFISSRNGAGAEASARYHVHRTLDLIVEELTRETKLRPLAPTS